MDYWSQQSVNDYLKDLLTDMEVNSNIALGSAAFINFAWDLRGENLPDPSGLGPDTWPEFQANPQFYYDYVNNRYPSSGPSPGAFRTFFVTHLQVNPNGVCPSDPATRVPLGVTVIPANNQVNTSQPLSRMTFLYLKDIVLIGNDCFSKGQAINTRITASALLTHELGHQRGGLTHANEFFQFHQGLYGSVPRKKFDVMNTGKSLVELTSNGTPAFDMLDSSPHDGDMTTCQGILGKWRSITN